MKEYLKKFIFFFILIIIFGIILRLALLKTINVRIIGDISTKSKVSGDVNASVLGSVDTKTKLKF